MVSDEYLLEPFSDLKLGFEFLKNEFCLLGIWTCNLSVIFQTLQQMFFVNIEQWSIVNLKSSLHLSLKKLTHPNVQSTKNLSHDSSIINWPKLDGVTWCRFSNCSTALNWYSKQEFSKGFDLLLHFTCITVKLNDFKGRKSREFWLKMQQFKLFNIWALKSYFLSASISSRFYKSIFFSFTIFEFCSFLILSDFHFCPIFNLSILSILSNFEFYDFSDLIEFFDFSDLFEFFDFSILSNFQFFRFFWFWRHISIFNFSIFSIFNFQFCSNFIFVQFSIFRFFQFFRFFNFYSIFIFAQFSFSICRSCRFLSNFQFVDFVNFAIFFQFVDFVDFSSLNKLFRAID